MPAHRLPPENQRKSLEIETPSDGALGVGTTHPGEETRTPSGNGHASGLLKPGEAVSQPGKGRNTQEKNIKPGENSDRQKDDHAPGSPHTPTHRPRDGKNYHTRHPPTGACNAKSHPKRRIRLTLSPKTNPTTEGWPNHAQKSHIRLTEETPTKPEPPASKEI